MRVKGTSRAGPPDRTGRSLVAATLAVVLAFLVTSGYTKYVASKIRIDTAGLHEDAVPAAMQLIRARSHLFRLGLAIQGPPDGNGTRLLAIQRERRALGASLHDYEREPFYPGEQEVYDRLQADLDRLDTHLAQAATRRPPDRADQAVVSDDLARLDDGLGGLVDLNIDRANWHAHHIEDVWQRSLAIELGLDVACVLLAITATILALRALRRYTSFLEERSRELESFSARVAHDVLSPLTTVNMALSLLDQRALEGAQVRELAVRGQSSLRRVRTLVDDLLAFARAGAQPAPGAQADLRTTIDGVLLELEGQAAEARVDLHVEGIADCQAACSPGVLTSMLSNLVRNAIKFMGDRAERRVTLRSRVDGQRVRVEVEDTGPGIPAGAQHQLFDPYFRGQTQQAGLGLGLSIVKRLADAHGGAVGVRSPIDQAASTGSLFWFELPCRPREGVAPA